VAPRLPGIDERLGKIRRLDDIRLVQRFLEHAPTVRPGSVAFMSRRSQKRTANY
jgi:hypothetical protein